MPMNYEWHDTHHMPGDPTPLERMSWHEAHQKHCGCGQIPADVLKMMPPSSQQT